MIYNFISYYYILISSAIFLYYKNKGTMRQFSSKLDIVSFDAMRKKPINNGSIIFNHISIDIDIQLK